MLKLHANASVFPKRFGSSCTAAQIPLGIQITGAGKGFRVLLQDTSEGLDRFVSFLFHSLENSPKSCFINAQSECNSTWSDLYYFIYLLNIFCCFYKHSLLLRRCSTAMSAIILQISRVPKVKPSLIF